MKSSQFSQITDELLSAYIDDDISAQERTLIETAIAADAEIAWRLESLRQTIQLLGSLPEIAPQRSFLLNESMVGDITRARQQAAARRAATAQSASPRTLPRGAPSVPEPSGRWNGFVQGWRAFWHGGNPMLRNLAAVSLALTLLVAGTDALVLPASSPASPALYDMQQETLAAPAAAPAMDSMADQAEESAPDAVAMTAPLEDAADDDTLNGGTVEREAVVGDTVETDLAEGDAVVESIEPGSAPDARMGTLTLGTPAVVEGSEGEAVTVDAETLAVAPEDVGTSGEPIDEGAFGDEGLTAPFAMDAGAEMGGGGGGQGMGGGGDGTGFGPPMPQPVPSTGEAAPSLAAVPEATLQEDSIPEAAVAATEDPAEDSESEAAAARIEATDESGEGASEASPELGAEPDEPALAMPDVAAVEPATDTSEQDAPEIAASADEDVVILGDVDGSMPEEALLEEGLLQEDVLQEDVPGEMDAEPVALLQTPATPEAAPESAPASTVETLSDAAASPRVGADAPQQAGLLGQLQWLLLTVALAFTALWWRSRGDTPNPPPSE